MSILNPRRLATLSVLAAMLAGTGTTTPATAATLPPATPAVAGGNIEAKELAALRLAAGHSLTGLTAEDRAVLARHPAVAADVIDPSLTEETGTPVRVERISKAEAIAGGAKIAVKESVGAAGGDTAAGNVVAGYYCAWTTRSKRYRSTFGFTIYRLNHHLKWCYQQGGSIHEIAERRYYLTDMDPVAEWQGISSSWKDGVGTTRVRSFYQGHIKLCALQIGCYANHYPKVGINGYNNGTSTYWT